MHTPHTRHTAHAIHTTHDTRHTRHDTTRYKTHDTGHKTHDTRRTTHTTHTTLTPHTPHTPHTTHAQVTRKAVVEGAMMTIVSRLSEMDSERSAEGKDAKDGGLRTVTFANNTATDIGALNPQNLKVRSEE